VKIDVVQLIVERTDFNQVSPDVPVTKPSPKDKIDFPQESEGWDGESLINCHATAG
jgi:hypothetical protein